MAHIYDPGCREKGGGRCDMGEGRHRRKGEWRGRRGREKGEKEEGEGRQKGREKGEKGEREGGGRKKNDTPLYAPTPFEPAHEIMVLIT